MSLRVNSILIGVLGGLLIASIAYSVIRTNDLDGQINDLEGQVASASKSANAEQETSSEGLEAGVKKLTGRVKKLEECIPEIQTEISSLGLERYGTEYFVETNSQVSSYCSDVVYGGGPGE